MHTNYTTVHSETMAVLESIEIHIRDQQQMLNQALAYLAHGWSVIPLGSEKKPLFSWKEYQSRHATEEEVRGWWRQYPDAQIGVVTGAISNLVVIDVEYGGNFEGFPATLTAKSGGAGRHFFYNHPGVAVVSSVRLRELTDIRADGAYLVVAPSRSEKGVYEWLSPWNAPLAELPEWVQQKQTEESEVEEERDWSELLSGNVLEGMRNMTGTQVAGKLLHDLPEEVWALGYGLFETWNSRLPKPMVTKELKTIWKSIGKVEKSRRKKQALQPVKLPPRDRIAKCPQPSTSVTFSEWQTTIDTHFPDLRFASEVALSVVSQFLIKDITNPFALVLVDVPSSGKTITINFFADIPELSYATDKFSPASFVSNAANIPKAKLAEIDLLPRLQYRLFLIRDLATLFSKQEDALNEALGTLTRVLDGEGLNTDSGTHGQREYNGEYLFMILAASTPIAPRVWKVMGNLGSRLFFLSINSRNKDKEELARQVADLSYKEKEKQCRLATKNFLYGLWNSYPQGIDWNRQADEKRLLEIIARCAMLLARLRGVINVWSDGSGTEYNHKTPVIEKPDRLNQLFYNLARAHALVSGRTQIEEGDLLPVVELCIDGAPTGRAGLFRKLIMYGGCMNTTDVEKEMNCSKPTALKEMKVLEILKVCTIVEYPGKDNEIILTEEFKWFVEEECRAIRKVTFVEKPTPRPVEEPTSDLDEEDVF